MALRGTLDTFALPDVLRLLGATSKTGRLRITGDRGTGSVWVSGGAVTSVDATHAPHANGSVDALFELLRFQDGSFTFDAGATDEGEGSPLEVEQLLVASEQLLAEWRDIEAVIPSMDLWVTLRSTLPTPEIVVDQGRWSTLVAVGAGATVRRIGDELCLGELAVSRAIKELVESGLAEIAEVAPTGASWTSGGASSELVRPLVAPDVVPEAALDPVDAPRPGIGEAMAAVPELEVAGPDPEPEPERRVAPEGAAPPKAVSGPRARRARGAGAAPVASEAGLFVPLDLPGHGPAPSYDAAASAPGTAPTPEPTSTIDGDAGPSELEELAAAFPGLAHRDDPAVDVGAELDDEEVAQQLAKLSPRAASAIRAAAAQVATGPDDEEAVDGDGPPLSRGLLLKFLSSVKS